ncbi:hypothetical protein N7508_005037 [Penicillium antarcticum]|uniref:uncharacterized protein n=1 Tax=Penicillium antarcticum TaxID=416450 RepID=UPI002390B83A|nr:uncharacterized protein N7508_005037 [Penicillium antarcticum]KAJ5306022.1 hypothetical protein N7508_005037 [Penicillium antarcticum]
MNQQPIKRPRLALSCVVCRRRKVRCGREHPECANCTRMNETCVYNTGVRDELTGRVQHVSLDDQSSNTNSRPTNHRSMPDTGVWPGTQAPGILGTPGSEVESPNASPLDPRPGYSTNRGASSDHNRRPSTAAKNAPNANFNPFATSEPSSAHRPVPICNDHLSLEQSGRSRFIGRAFWGSIAGKVQALKLIWCRDADRDCETQSDDFFKSCRVPHEMDSYASAAKVFSLLKTLPTRPVSNALLEVFFIAVWPICPLVDRFSLQKDYDDFWDWCGRNDEALPSQKFIDDPTFFCLLFAILYCGASAAPEAHWGSVQLQNECKDTILQQLKTNYTASLSQSRHLEHPTINTLVSALLIGPFVDKHHEPMQNLVSISTTVRIAQSMGLHREATWSALNHEAQETRRRIWWHIVWLDLQSSVSTGLPPCCGSDALDGVSVVASGVNDGAIISSEVLDLTSLFVIGRSESTRLQWNIVFHLQSLQEMTTNKLSDLAMDAKRLEQTLDTLIGRISTQTVMEGTSQSTDFTRWTRAMLTLMQLETAILLHKPVLVSPIDKDSNSKKLWTRYTFLLFTQLFFTHWSCRIVHLCVAYLRVFIWFHDTPALSPYRWYWNSQYGPLQCALLTLTYLQQSHSTSDIPKARSCLDDYMRLIVAQYQAPSSSPESHPASDYDTGEGQLNDRMPIAMQFLIDLHISLDLTLGGTPQAGNTASALTNPILTGNEPGLDVESIPNMAEPEFEAWAAFSLSQIF